MNELIRKKCNNDTYTHTPQAVLQKVLRCVYVCDGVMDMDKWDVMNFHHGFGAMPVWPAIAREKECVGFVPIAGRFG